MKNPISWQDLPNWVPGKVGLCSSDLGWKNVGLRSFLYQGQDVHVPAMKEFLLVGYRQGVTPMQRRFDGRWSRETLSPGAASFLTRAQPSHWTWDEPVDVIHVYLSGALMTEVADEMFGRRITDITLEDVLRTVDPVVTHAMTALATEAAENGMGGALYVDALSRALAVHLLRHYAAVRTDGPRGESALSPTQQSRIADFIGAHIAEPLDLAAMAAVLDMPPCLFARQFKAAFGSPPYAFVMQRRLDRARGLLAKSQMAIKEIAADCGFSDQAHMTRLFRRAFGTPPAEYRRGFQ